MTQFATGNRANSSFGQSSGRKFIEEAEDHLTDVLQQCAASYNGESVEDYTQTILEEAWPVIKADVIQSFKNGKKAR